MKQNKVTQYMRDQIVALDSEGLIEFVKKTKFTAEQRKLILKELGDVERDPRSTTAEIVTAQVATAVIEQVPPVPEQITMKPEKVLAEDKKKNRTFFEIPDFI